MKIAIAGMAHESNTFNKSTTGLESFKIISGDVYLENRRTDDSPAGIYETLIENGSKVVPLIFARAIPSGTVKREVYEYVKTQILTGLCDNGPWDGVCLALHGSMVTEDSYDPEGDLLEEIRRVTGCDIPVVCSLDMHATVTERMVSLSNGFTVFRTAPHTDEKETGIRAAEILLKIIKKNKKTVNAFVKIPILVSGEQSETRVDPAKALFESLKGYDNLPYVLCSSYVMGFPWADSPFGGAGALVTGWEDDREKLNELAKKMADAFWEKRADFTFSTPAMQPEQAIKEAIEANEFPVIISDAADNPTAGASQDTTGFLRLMIESDIKNAIYTCIADPAAYKKCASHKIGDEVTLSLGGHYSNNICEKFTLNAEIINIARLNNTKYAVMQAKEVKFLISDRRCATYDPETLRNLGLEPESFNIIGIKAGYLSPEYQAMNKLSILALTEGDTALELEKLPYNKTPRPIYPLDPEMVFYNNE